MSAFARIYSPHFELAFKRGIALGLLSGKFTLEDVFTLEVKVALQAKAFEHAALAVKTTKEQLQGIIGKAIEEGQGTDELARAIRDSFAIDGKVRAPRIARTEMTDVINDGTHEALRKERYQQKEWSTVVDGRERESHAAANGQVVDMNALFVIGGASAMFPGDANLPAGERVNCRCVIVGAGLPEDRIRHLGRAFLRTHGSLENKFVVSLRRAFRDQRDRILSRLPQ